MALVELSDWLDANSLLVFSLVMPATSCVVAMAASWFSVRRTLRSEEERRAHEAAIQISHFRQQWINELRDCLSTLQSIGVHPRLTPADQQDFYRLGTKIELMMNPLDEDYDALQDLMYQFLSVESGDVSEKDAINPEFVEVSQRILKREWERLKNELRAPNRLVGSK